MHSGNRAGWNRKRVRSGGEHRRRPRAGCSTYQQPDGHWVFELEADCTIPAEYVLLRHYLGEPVDAALEAKIANLPAPRAGRAWRLAAGA